MRLCTFDAGHGPRLGHVRRNHIVDVAALDPRIPGDRASLARGGDDVRARLAALADACPMPGMLLRRETVRVLDEWEQPEA